VNEYSFEDVDAASAKTPEQVMEVLRAEHRALDMRLAELDVTRSLTSS